MHNLLSQASLSWTTKAQKGEETNMVIMLCLWTWQTHDSEISCQIPPDRIKIPTLSEVSASHPMRTSQSREKIELRKGVWGFILLMLFTYNNLKRQLIFLIQIKSIFPSAFNDWGSSANEISTQPAHNIHVLRKGGFGLPESLQGKASVRALKV